MTSVIQKWPEPLLVKGKVVYDKFQTKLFPLDFLQDTRFLITRQANEAKKSGNLLIWA